MQTFSIIGLLITMFIAQYYVIRYFSGISSPLTFGDFIVYLLIFLAFFLSIKNKVLSSIIIICGIYVLVGLEILLDLPIIIFNSLTDGRFQFGCYLLFNTTNIIIGIVLLIAYLT
ncbi:hypothetical protein M973_09990 [Francisella orientalis LADL 07-285A]|nr:hypothetical protein M973_09990 [Francisella orientalis LADL 07-285A]